MKKILLLAVFAVFGLTTSNAQEANIGVHAALPTGGVSTLLSFGAAVDANYLWEVSDDFNAGVSTGFNYYFGKNGFQGVGVLPISAAGRFNVSDEFTIGADLGYAFGVVNSSGGDFYYAPKVQYSISDSMDIVLSYRGFQFASLLSVGLEFSLN